MDDLKARLEAAEQRGRALREALQAFVAYDQVFPHVLSGDVPPQLSRLIVQARKALLSTTGPEDKSNG